MQKEKFEAWHKAGHSGINQKAIQDYCSYLANVEIGLGKNLDDFPVEKEGQVLDRIFQGQHFTGTSEKDLSSYRSAVRKYWKFRKWILKNSL